MSRNRDAYDLARELEDIGDSIQKLEGSFEKQIEEKDAEICNLKLQLTDLQNAYDVISYVEGRILNIKNAPSLPEALSKFTDHWIRPEGTTLLRTENDSNINTVEDLSLIMADTKSFLHYASEEGISKEVIDRCLEAFSQ